MRLSGVLSAVKAHWRSSIALGFALLHGIVLLAVISSEPPLPSPCPEPDQAVGSADACFDEWQVGTGIIVAGRYFHQHPIWFIQLADVPAMVVAMVVLGLPLYLTGMEFSPETDSYILGWVWLLFGTIQWWLCGIWLMARRAQRSPRYQWRPEG